MHIGVIGYYEHKNFGDDLFQYIFTNILLPQFQLTILDFDKLSENVTTFDAIVIGGGDLINQYFFTPLNIDKLQSLQIPIYFVGIGITYPDTLPLLDIGDYFFMRSKHDTQLVENRFPSFTYYTPDIAFSLTLNTTIPINHSSGIQKLGISLPYTWITENTFYERILDNIVQTLTALSCTFELVFIPFDLSNSPTNSDLLFIKELERRTQSISHKITYLKPTEWTPETMIQAYQTIDAIIGSRYHSIIMALICEKPFICLNSTPKLDHLKNDLPTLQHLFLPIEKDLNLNPIKVNMNLVLFALQSIVFNYTNYVQKIQTIKKEIKSSITHTKNTLEKIIFDKKIRHSPPTLLTSHLLDKTLKNTILQVLQRIYNQVTLTDIDKITSGQTLATILPKSLFNDNTRKTITEEILWLLCGDPNGPYYYGLYENVFTQNFTTQIKWIITDYYKHFKIQNKKPSNVTIINKNFQLVHRSGWQAVVDQLISKIQHTETPFIIDTYVDKTFHWNQSFYKFKGIIPYTQPWVGFIHHTFENTTNDFNCIELFQNTNFLNSLIHCKCLIVMSHTLQYQINETLLKLNFNVRVVAITHPTDFNVIPFQWSKFLNNPQPKVIQIGNWLRNMYAIYDLTLPRTSIVKQKAILKNKNTDSYFLPPQFFESFLNHFLHNTCQTVGNVYDICKITFQNQHLKGMYQTLLDDYKSVTILEHLPNHQYDLLLSENIVFLNLIDASAVNTIIECIVRNTPILINPIEAVVEILGTEYPLYYTDFFQASTLLNDSTKLLQAHIYLQNLDKTKFTLEHFTQEIQNIFTKIQVK